MTDDRMDTIIGNLLRAGVALSAAVVAAGGAWYLAAGGSGTVDYRRFRGETRGLHSLVELPGPQALILIGLLILIATPVARVVFSLIAFALERDRAYVMVTAIVLIALLYSIGTAWW
ncbi:conserved membrane hypothetical protein [Candidatus Sulfopaludibacter sp. SbA4]|nr:conserved membrane hypothetical protein [Candidatus Sulfopaludibacter sp. SbA4]